MRESVLLRSVLDWLQFQQNMGKLMYLRLNSGSIFLEGRAIRMCPKGTADVLVVQQRDVQCCDKCAIPYVFFLETKSKRGKLSLEQERFKKMAEAQGCEYLLVRDVQQVIERLEGVRYVTKKGER